MTETPKAPTPVARRIASTRPSALKALRMRVQELKSQGREIIDLASGNPEREPPSALLEGLTAGGAASCSYSDPRGLQSLRASIARQIGQDHEVHYDEDAEITVVAGATGALSAAIMALVDPGVGMTLFTPFYEGLESPALMAGASLKYVPLKPPHWSFDASTLATALSGHVRFLLLNNPHNPTGRVFASELETIARICTEKGITVISDEAYDSFWFTRKPRSIASLPGMRERTVVIHSWSKAFNAPGLKVGSIAAPAALTAAIRQAAGVLCGTPATNVQEAFAAAMPALPRYAEDERRHLKSARNQLRRALTQFGLTVASAQATTSLWAAIPGRRCTDVQLSDQLLEHTGILAAPGRAFMPAYIADDDKQRQFLRFSFNRKRSTIDEAVRRLSDCPRPF